MLNIPNQMMKFLNKFVVYTIAALGLFCLPAKASKQNEFIFRAREDLGTLDWGQGEVNSEVVTQLMEGLTTVGLDAKPKPALAQSWNFKNGMRSITFYLRKNARWSDGNPVCASDFINAWTRVLSPNFQSSYAHYLFEIKGARGLHARSASEKSLGLKAIGCKILRVDFEGPTAHFPALASHWVFLPVRMDQLAQLRAGGNFATTGPYVLTEWKKETHFKLTQNPNYYDHARYGKRPEKLTAYVIASDNAALHLFQTQKLDWAREIPFLEKKKLIGLPEFKSFPAFVVYYLSFRFSKNTGPNLSPNFVKEERCLLAKSLDKSQIPKLFSGLEKPAESLVPFTPVQTMNQHKPSPGAIWPKNNRTLELYFYAKDIHTPLMEWLQKQWKQTLGLDVKLTKMEGKAYWAFLQQSPPALFLSGTTAAYAHPFAFLSEFSGQSPANWGHFESKTFEQLAEKTKETTSSQALNNIVKKAEKLLLQDECAIIPLYFRNTETLVSKKWQGFEVTPTGLVYLKTLKPAPKLTSVQ